MAITATSTPIAQGLTDGLMAWYPLQRHPHHGQYIARAGEHDYGPAQYFDGINDYHQTTVDLANKSFTVALAASANDDNANTIAMIVSWHKCSYTLIATSFVHWKCV
jgi:hypothetical protein